MNQAVNDHDKQASTEKRAENNAPLATPRVVRSDDLLRGQNEILIRHGDETYRLRCTRQGKLILYK